MAQRQPYQRHTPRTVGTSMKLDESDLRALIGMIRALNNGLNQTAEVYAQVFDSPRRVAVLVLLEKALDILPLTDEELGLHRMNPLPPDIKRGLQGMNPPDAE